MMCMRGDEAVMDWVDDHVAHARTNTHVVWR